MNCATQCDGCGTCLVDGFTDDVTLVCPRCGASYGDGGR